MKNKIKLSTDHPNALRMQFFLNGIDDELKEIPYDWRTLKLSDRVTDGRQFISTSAASPVTIRVLFCDSYGDAHEIAKANAFPNLPHAKWGINGDLLYLVESQDEEKVTTVLSFFAGEE